MFTVTCLWDYYYESVGGESADAAKRKFFPLKAVASASLSFFFLLNSQPFASCFYFSNSSSHLHYSGSLEIERRRVNTSGRVPVELRWFLQLSLSWFMKRKVIKQRQQFLRNRAD